MPKEKLDIQKTIARAKVVEALTDKLSDEWKKLGDEYDSLALELEHVPNLEAYGLRIENQFAKGNTQWGHSRVRRLKIVVLDEKPALARSSEGTRKRKASEKSSE